MNIFNLEFLNYENELWLRHPDGHMEKLVETMTDTINAIVDEIETFYPNAFTALCAHYAKCKPNTSFFKYRIVVRFLKCNFGEIDDINDVDYKGDFTFEHVRCPLRGECQYEHVICHPEYESKLSKAELRVLEPLYKGEPRQRIAETLCLSLFTVNNHIANGLRRLKLKSVAEFVKYASDHKLF